MISIIIGIIWNGWLWSTFVSSYKHDKFATYLPSSHLNGCYEIYKRNPILIYTKSKSSNRFICFNTLKELPAHE